MQISRRTPSRVGEPPKYPLQPPAGVKFEVVSSGNPPAAAERERSADVGWCS